MQNEPEEAAGHHRFLPSLAKSPLRLSQAGSLLLRTHLPPPSSSYESSPIFPRTLPTIVERVSNLLASDALKGSTSLVIDATGVGRPVVDLFRQTLAWPLVAVTITGGGRVSWDGQEYRVPKADLVGSVQAAGGSGKLKLIFNSPRTYPQTCCKQNQ